MTAMANPDYLKDTHTPPRQIRIGDDWYEFQAAFELMDRPPASGGSERAENIRDYIRWFLRKSGGPAPRRPDPSLIPQIRARGAEIKAYTEARNASRARKGK